MNKKIRTNISNDKMKKSSMTPPQNIKIPKPEPKK